MNRSSLGIIALGLLAAGYGLQLFSPLRMNTDATNFLQMGASATDGLGFVSSKDAEHHPIGYPALISALDRAGIACSAVFIGINLVGLTAGLIAAGSILRKSFGWSNSSVLIAAIATMLNWAIIKHVTIPLTEFPYFGLSLLCVAVLSHAASRDYPERIPSLSLGGVLLIQSVLTRTIGIALVPAFVFAAVSGSPLQKLAEAVRSRRLVAAGLMLGLLAAGCAAFLIVSRTNYFREMLETWKGVTDLAIMRLDDWGELILNTSMAKVPGRLRGLQLIAGVSAATLIFWGFAKRRRIEVVDVYMAGYLTILLAWPYRDARFWIPVFPLLLSYVTTSLRPFFESHRFRWMVPTYAVAYTLMGLVALGYSSWLSFSGDKFGDRFAGGVYRDSYRTAFRTGPVPPRGEAKIDPQIVRLLERYRLYRPDAPTHSMANSVSAEFR